MDSSTPWIIFVAIIVIIFIALGIYFQYNTVPPVDISKIVSSNFYGPIMRWGDPVPVDGASCQGYQYPSTKSDLSGVLTVGVPTLNSTVLDNPGDYDITVGSPFACLDSDTLNAIKVEHTCGVTTYSCDKEGNCITSVRTSGNPPTTEKGGCRRLDGTLASFGEKETFYTVCNSDTRYGSNSSKLYCPGQVGGVSVGYQAEGTDDIPCLVKNSDGSIGVTTGDGCTVGSVTQQFQIIQTSPGVTPTTSQNQGQQGNQGIIVAFVDRVSGKCIVPSNDKFSLVLGDCSPYNGYVWALIPPLVYDPTLGASAQQIVYVGDGELKDFFKLSLNSPNDLYQYLTSINGLSMSNDDGQLTLKPYTKAGFPGSPGQLSGVDRNAQLMTFLLYNVLNGSKGFTPF